MAMRRDSSASCARLMPCRRRRRSCALTWSKTSPSPELLVVEIERRAEIAAAKARQAAADHVDRPQHDLRQQHATSAPRSSSAMPAASAAAPSDSFELAPHQQRRQADADLAERLSPSAIGCVHSRLRLARVDGAQLREPRWRDQLVQLRPRRHGLARPASGSLGAMTDAGRIDDRRVDDVLGVERRLERRLDVLADAQRRRRPFPAR